MKILVTRFPLESIPGGGAETQVMHLSKGLAERGHAVAYVGSCKALTEAFEQSGMINAELDIGPPPVSKVSIARFALKKKSMQKKLEDMLQAFGSLDVIVMLSLSEKLLLTETAAKRGMKVLWIEHDPVGMWLTKNPWKKLLRKQSELATTVTVSELSRIQYLEMGWNPKKTIAIPNGIAESWFSEEPMSKAKTKRQGIEDLHVGCVARLAKEKGVNLLIRAIADVPHTTLDIVGVGPEERALKKQVAELGLHHRVRFLGRVDDLPHFYRLIDALVLPSRTIDPFGMVVAEALAMGIPSVITDACGIASCLKPESDVLIVPQDNRAKLSKAIKRLHDEELQHLLSANGQRAARQQFQVKTMVDRYETLFTGRPIQ